MDLRQSKKVLTPQGYLWEEGLKSDLRVSDLGKYGPIGYLGVGFGPRSIGFASFDLCTLE